MQKDWFPEDKLEKLDPILKKIKEKGIISLDESEKRTLDTVSVFLKSTNKNKK